MNKIKGDTGSAKDCQPTQKYGPGPPSTCHQPSDPNNKPKSELESWLTEAMFNVCFPNKIDKILKNVY
jgi:hypothetical protein